MSTIDLALLPISAPILVPGTQREPTTPSLSSSNTSTSTTIIVTKEQGGSLSRFPSIGNTKKLLLENLTLRSKVAELERYLRGLKEELILAHRQVHSKNLEAKISQERKAVEIHELGQHIQRCEFDLLAKTAECEALQNRLAYQTKEQVTKLKHIHTLENEIMDYKRMSVMSGGAASTISTATGSNRIMSRHSRSSADLTTGTNNNININSVRSSTVLEADSMIKRLKEDNACKEDQIKELTERLERLEKLGLERAQGHEEDKTQEVDEEKHQDMILGSDSYASFNTASTTGQQPHQQQQMSTSLSVNSVGYDVSVEHPKLLAKYQALRMSHAQASEYVDNLESENRELKVQLLEVTPAPLSSTDITDSSSVIAPTLVKSISTALLAPLDTDSATKDGYPSIPSPASTNPSSASSASPSSAVAPALTPKSSLRYNRDGQSSPTPSA
ncbi:hypothetical protein BG006_001332 [Podila minutissima]|uniref:Uncharacterized protein n=1 Tax=Podila minutissima TaxID=64525 RepID=A0A9P5SRC8_9FUNG|nr:hypothetical protein BG006_001332 [Podila minutissima]